MISETRDETGPPADAGYMTRGRKSIITGTKTFSRDEWLEGKSSLTNWADLTEGARSNNNTEQREEDREGEITGREMGGS